MNELSVFNENKIWSNLCLTLSKELEKVFLNFSEFCTSSGNNTVLELVGIKDDLLKNYNEKLNNGTCLVFFMS